MIKESIRLGEERLNNQDCLMKIIEYNDANNMFVEFQDEYKAKVHTNYKHFKNGNVRNPYYKSVFNIGVVGEKYKTKINKKHIKEYTAWSGLLERCFDMKYKENRPTYEQVACCEEWLLFENFYEWIHNQENFEQWLNGERWAIDKDILNKGNKTYNPENCCLVPINVNSLFVKNDTLRSELPIGVRKSGSKFSSYCQNPFTGKRDYIGIYFTPEEAFYAYKKYKENLIKEVARIEYSKGNITKKCYEAMMNYEVEITD